MRMVFRTRRKDEGGTGPGGGGVEPQTDPITVGSNGQTIFVLSGTPETASEVEVIFLGVDQDYGIDYTVAGNVLTWLNTDFSLVIGEVLKVRYFITVP